MGWTRTTRLAARGGRLHRPGDPRAGPHDADVTRRATASVGHRTAASRGETNGRTAPTQAVPRHDRFHHSGVDVPAMPMPRMQSRRLGYRGDPVNAPPTYAAPDAPSNTGVVDAPFSLGRSPRHSGTARRLETRAATLSPAVLGQRPGQRENNQASIVCARRRLRGARAMTAVAAALVEAAPRGPCQRS
jgi:hypothetical protein